MKALLKNIRNNYQARAARRLLGTLESKQPPLLILMYHRVLPLDDGRLPFEEPGMFVSPQTLEMHLATLAPLVEFVDLQRWIDSGSDESATGKVQCAVTFDDGWLDNYEFALPVLQQFEVPATIFLATGFIGTGRLFWPERLARLLTITALLGQDNPVRSALDKFVSETGTSIRHEQLAAGSTGSREHSAEIIAACKQYADDRIYSFLDEAYAGLDRNSGLTIETASEMLDWHQVTAMAPTFTVGAHTVNHLRLNDTAEDSEVDSELDDCAEAIATRLGTRPSLFCYPNGDVSDYARKAVESRFSSAVTTSNGLNQRGESLYTLKRIGMHEDASNTPEAFLAKLYRGITTA